MTTNVNLPPASDPIPIALARIEEKLDSALRTQEQHAGQISVHDTRIDRVEDRMTALETRHNTENTHSRVTALEKRIWGWVGASSLLSSGGVAAIFHYLS